MIEESNQQITEATSQNQHPQLAEVYQQLDFIDAKDNQGDWRMGIIIEKNEKAKQWKVRFDGWPAKWDEIYKFNSPKLKHLRLITVGYTGQKTHPAVRPHWKFSLSDNQKKIQEFKQFLHENRFTMKGYQVTQYLRGKHYIHIDCLLQTTFIGGFIELKSAIDYLKCHIDFCLDFIKNLDPIFKLHNQDIVLNREAAFANSFYEIFDGCTSIFGGYKRINPFYKNNETLLLQIKQIKTKPHPQATMEQISEFYIRSIFFSYFNDKGGWNIIAKLFEKLLQQKTFIPFIFLESFISMYNQLDKLNIPIKVKKHNEMLIEILKRNLNAIDEKKIKNLDRVSVGNAVDKMIVLLQRNVDRQRSSAAIAKTVSNHQQTQQKIKQLQLLDLQISYLFFKSPYFQKKLKGITCLKDSLSKIHLKKISAKEFYEWALEVNLIKEICDDNTHVEIIKRASQIIKLFCENKVLTNKELDILWQSRQDKHEATLKALDQLLFDVAPHLLVQQLDYLFNKIIKLDVNKWQDNYLELVKRFSEFAIRQDKRSSNDYGIPSIYAYACLKQDERSINALFDLLNMPYMDKHLLQYRNKCFNRIKQGVYSFFHIQLLLKIESNTISQTSIDRKIIDIIIKDIIRNSSKVDQLQTRFDLLNLLLPFHQSDVSLQESDLQELWTTFKTNNNPQTQIFINWICSFQQTFNCYRIRHYFSNDLKQYLFTDILCNPKKNDFFNMDINQCNIFLCFFVDVNISHNKLIRAKQLGTRFKVKSLDLIGLTQLWKIFMNCKNEIVIRRIAEFISDLHNKLAIDLQKQRQNVGLRLIQKCVQHISSGTKKQNHRLVKSFLLLLSIFMKKVEGLFILEENIKPRSTFTRQYSIINTITHQKHEINFNVSLPFGFMRRGIAKLMNENIKHFELQHKSKTIISVDNDDVPISECAIGLEIYFIPCLPKQNYVKKILNRHLDIFLELLSTDYSQDAWKIVSVLPISEEMKIRISKINDWRIFLSGGIYKQLYLLKIIEDMKLEQWQQFIQDHGVLSILGKLNIQVKSQIEIQYLTSLTNILIKCLCSQRKDQRLFISQTLIDVSNQLINILTKLIFYSMKEKDDDNTNQQTQLLNNIFQILNKIKSYVKILTIFAKLANLDSLLVNGLMNSPNKLLRQTFCTSLLKLIIYQQKDQPNQAVLISIIVFKALFEKVIIQSQNTKIYFQFCMILIQRLDKNVFKQVFNNIEKIDSRLIRYLEEDYGDKNFEEENQTFWGVSQLLKQILSKKQFQIQNYNPTFLVNYIVNQCLFEFKKPGGPKSKTQSTRLSLFQLLWVLLFKNPNHINQILSFLQKFHKNGQWRTKKWSEWCINPKVLEKSSTGYVGLKNLGCICYMNSFLQQIFMIKSFRQQILNAQDPLFGKVKEEDNLLYQLKSMFIALQKSDQQYYNPKPFTVSFKDYDGKPTNVLQQMDIDQFAGFLFDKIESQLKQTKSDKNIVNNHFGGVISNEIICKGCPHYSQNRQNFVSLGLQVKNKNNIYQSLDTLIKGQMLEGQNAYHCDRCSKKVSALKRGCLKQLPNHLIIALKRFDFNYETMAKIKINDYCEFPTELNLEKYSQNYLRKTQGNDNKFGEDETLVQYPSQYYEYILKGVVVHLGFADNGHYYSYIEQREKTGEWFQFNDSIVRTFDFENLGNESFGGQEKTMDVNVKQKNRNAYLLFYDRKIKLDSKGNLLPIQQNATSRINLPYLSKFISDLKNSNERYYLFRLIFSSDYDGFLKCILTQGENITDQSNKQQLLNFALLFFLTKTLREKQKKNSFEIGQQLVQKAKLHPQFASRILKIFSDQGTINQFLKNNPLKQMRKLLGNFLIEVAKIKYQTEAQGPNNRLFECIQGTKISNTILGNFINALLKIVFGMKGLCNNQIYMMLAKISEFGPQTAEFMLQKRVLPSLLQFIQQKEQKVKIQFEILKQQDLIGKAAVEDQRQTISQYLSMKKAIKKQEQKTYFWYLLSELIKHCDLKVKNKYPEYFTQTAFDLGEDLLTVYLNTTFIYDQLYHVKSKLMMRKLIKYICTICIQNLPLSVQIPKAVFGKAHKILQGSKFRNYLVLAKHFIRIPDSINRYSIANEMKTSLEDNKAFSVELDIITQWIIKIIRKNEKFANYLKMNNSLLKLMQVLNKEKPVKQQSTKKHRVLNEKAYNTLHGVMLLKSQESYAQLNKYKDKQLSALLANKPLPIREDQQWDSDDDLAQKQVIAQQNIMAFVDKGILNLVQVKVVSNILDKLTVQYNGQLLTFWKDQQLLTSVHKVFTFDQPKLTLLDESDETASLESCNDTSA